MMFGYALVSAAGATGREWRNLEAATSHIAAVEYASRLNSKCGHALQTRIAETEMAIRTEWAKAFRTDPTFSLTDAIALIARAKLRPLVAEFKTSKGGWGKGDAAAHTVGRTICT